MNSKKGDSAAALPALQFEALEKRPESISVLGALALANAVGFMPSTAMPIWVAQVAPSLQWPSWTGGALASVQLACLAIANLAAPRAIRIVPCVRLGRLAALSAAIGFVLMAFHSPVFMALGAMLSGAGCGMLLAVVNSIVAGFPNAQRSFALLQLVLVIAGVIVFFALPRLKVLFGISSVFAALSIFAGLALLALRPVRSVPSIARQLPQTHRPPFGAKAYPIFAALALTLAGQTAMMASVVAVGATLGLSLTSVGMVLSAGAVLCLLGPLGAHALGERFGLIRPLGLAMINLALTEAWLPHVSSTPMFFILVTLLMGLPLFMLPYALAWLARLDAKGTWSAIAPGFMMAGAALGPSLGTFVQSVAPLSVLGEWLALSVGIAIAIIVLSRAASFTSSSKPPLL